MKDETTTPTLLTRAPASGVSSLEANLEICQAEIRKALARAEAIDPVVDEYGHGLVQAHSAAMRYLKMSAKLGMALAKMKGEHTSIIHVHKTETVLSSPPEPVLVPDRRNRPALVRPVLTPAEQKAKEARIDKIYNDWLATRAAEGAQNHGVDEGDDGEEDDDFEGDEDREEGDPPANFGGSNTSEP
ncbi:MAG TPA: hypothetical protein VII35_08345 [Steroidobacteraceae bacterium]